MKWSCFSERQTGAGMSCFYRDREDYERGGRRWWGGGVRLWGPHGLGGEGAFRWSPHVRKRFWAGQSVSSFRNRGTEAAPPEVVGFLTLFFD